jgi:NADH dehydrogenase (ubiquinone) 1 alpha subcomplex subunit 9
VTVFGATGFIGKYVVSELAKGGSQVVVPFRAVEEAAMPLKQMGDLGQVVPLRGFHLRDDGAAAAAIARSNIVINLVGSTRETRNFSFDDVHADWPARLAKLAADAGHVERFVHFSDAGASPSSASARMRSKAAGDAAVRAAVPSATIFRPCNVVGDEDDFFNNLLYQAKTRLAMALPEGGGHVTQPHHVTDVAAAVSTALRDASTLGRTYYLGGQERVTLADIVALIYGTLHETEHRIVPLPSGLAKLWRAPLDALRRSLPPMPAANYMFTADYLDEVAADKVVPPGVKGYADLGIVPLKVTEGIAIEAFRYGRYGGYSLGNAATLARHLPDHVRRMFGL